MKMNEDFIKDVNDRGGNKYISIDAYDDGSYATRAEGSSVELIPGYFESFDELVIGD